MTYPTLRYRLAVMAEAWTTLSHLYPGRDSWATDATSWQKYKSEWQDGARAAGKNPAEMAVMLKHYVVVDDEAAARKAAHLWRSVQKLGIIFAMFLALIGLNSARKRRYH